MTEENSNFKNRGALDAFLNLLNLITLGWVAISLGQVLFWIINKFFSPEFIDPYVKFSQTGLKFGIASLIIVTPVFFIVTGYLHQQYKKHQLNSQSGVYRWLTYLMLLISALNIIGSLIAIIFNLLDGDYTSGTILKILTVLVIASGIFGYYWYDLRRQEYKDRSGVSIAFMIVVIVVILGAVIGSFFLIDSPQVTRKRNFDIDRSSDLSELDYMIKSDFRENGVLPADFSSSKYSVIVDPETKKPYGYEVISEKKYKLCADFSLEIKTGQNRFGPTEDWYYHDSSYQCFMRNALMEGEVDKPVIIR